MCTEKIFFEVDISKIGKIKASFYEIIATGVTVLIYNWVNIEQDNIILIALQNWTTVYIPLAAIWVFLFSLHKGLITSLLANRVLVYTGNISAYAFLIHYVITQLTPHAIWYFNLDVSGVNKTIRVGIQLILSIILSVFYKYVHEKIGLYNKLKKCSVVS